MDRLSRAYIAGARDAFDYASLFMSAPEALALREWIEVDLAQWSEGQPPASPDSWLDE